jgi:hypothetical protein
MCHETNEFFPKDFGGFSYHWKKELNISTGCGQKLSILLLYSLPKLLGFV